MTARVYLHVGEPKSGTTFLQGVLWGNRSTLARQGVVLPGLHPQEHFRANQDLREVPQQADDPSGSWAGEWNLLARQAARADKVAIISHELLSAATAEQASRAIASLQPAEVHVVLTVRDFARLLPAEWQETIKHRNRQTWERWVRRVIRAAGRAPDARMRWFWQVHDTTDVLRRWSAGLPPEHIHVITVPPPGAPPTLLWERFASVIGVDPTGVDLSAARVNASLGLAEVELLRRLNEALRPDDVPDWFYAVHVKELIAHSVLAQRPVKLRPGLSKRQENWARERASELVAELGKSGYDIVGDLDDLIPPVRTNRRADGVRRRSAGAPSSDVLDAAVTALAAVLRDQYAPPPGRRYEGAGVVDRGAAWVAASPRAKRLVRTLSTRHAVVRKLRVLAWRIGARGRARRAGR